MAEISAWFAFAGRAFLSTDWDVLRTMAGELEENEMEHALVGDPAVLEKEYRRLFLDPQGALCPPWQSAHAEERRLLKPTHQSALSWYRLADVAPRQENGSADHIGLLLAFYGFLLDTERKPDLPILFWREHLQWIPAFCAQVEVAARHPFYRTLAGRTAEMVRAAGCL